MMDNLGCFALMLGGESQAACMSSAISLEEVVIVSNRWPQKVGVFGAASRKTELRALMDNVLASIEGESNWSGTASNASSARTIGKYFGIIVFVGAVVVGVIVVAIKSRHTPSAKPPQSANYP